MGNSIAGSSAKNQSTNVFIQIKMKNRQGGTSAMKEDKAAILAEVAAALTGNQFVAARDILSDRYRFTEWSKTPRRNSPEKMIKVFARDGFVDRYSGTRLVLPAALQLMSKLVPDALPYHRNWKTSACHSAYWELCATIDHSEPVGLAGPDEESNWYTTSMAHNAAKSLYTLQQLGWQLHPPGDIRDWDGLTGWFLERAKEVLEHGKADRTLDGFRKWYNAANAAIKQPPWAIMNSSLSVDADQGKLAEQT